MKTIGLLGGMSWESTLTYYQIINRTVQEKLGGLHSAKILLYSLDFAEIEACQAREDWEASAEILCDGARRLETAGADCLVICTNTMHKLAPQLQSAVSIPLLHIAEATAALLVAQGLERVALLGTVYTMTQDFYRGKVAEAGLSVLVPEEADREIVNQTIYGELCRGLLSPASKREFLRIIEDMKECGAQGVILGCTEIGLLIKEADSPLPVFDTAEIHAKKAAQWALTD